MHEKTPGTPLALTAESYLSNPQELRQVLEQCGALEFAAYPSGLFPASDLPKELGEATGMDMAWFRDNTHVALALYETGHIELAAAAGRAMLGALNNNRDTLDSVVSGKEPDLRLPVRVRGADLANDTEPRMQHDSTGYALLLVSKLIADEVLRPSKEDLDTIVQVARYLGAVEYWRDADEGHWEEDRRVQAASIGTVIAGLRAARTALRWHGRSSEVPFAELIANGHNALDRILASGVTDLPPSGELPSISPIEQTVEDFTVTHRKYDAAMLFLVTPLGVLEGQQASDVVAGIETNLLRERGTARYPGDTYWAPRFPHILGIEQRTSTAPGLIDTRNRLAAGIAYTQTEAQWTLFDPLLSEYYGRLHERTGDIAHFDRQLFYLNRSLAQLVPTADGGLRLPEAFYYENVDGTKNVWIANDHTPLLWSQANLLRALKTFEQTAPRAATSRQSRSAADEQTSRHGDL